MSSPFSSWDALPGGRALRRPDVMLAFVVAAMVAMLIIPLPGWALDVLIAVNLAMSVLVLMTALFARTSLELSSFPTLLLLTTLFRLGLNVSTTRGILAHAEAGALVAAFGRFVIQGDLVVGIVIFLVLTLVQFLVIAKGAERVAEVAARFTLDAMPGKQMSIDAALRNGAIDDVEAQKKRDELGRESQLFGNMDGAMKFVKGDAIAGLIITAINICAGMVIGVTRNGLELGRALGVYSTLTVGDGLVSQVAALLVTLAAAILVTHVAHKDETPEGMQGYNVGFKLRREVLQNPRALAVAAVLMLAFAIIPGLPAVPFLIISAILGGAAGLRGMLQSLGSVNPAAYPGGPMVSLDHTLAQVRAQQHAVADQVSPSVVPLELELGSALSQALGFGPGADPEHTRLLQTYVPQLRDALYLETGVLAPRALVRTDAHGLPPDGFVIRVNDVPITQGRLPLDRLLVIAKVEELARLGITAEATEHPINQSPAALIEQDAKALAEASNFQVWDLPGFLALHLAAVLKKRLSSFLGLEETAQLVERMEKSFPSLVKEVIPKTVNLPQLLGVLRRLVDEGVSIRDLKSIFEALGEHGGREHSPLALTEIVRGALGQQLAYHHARESRALSAVLLDPAIEDQIASQIEYDRGGEVLTMEPELRQSIVTAIIDALRPSLTAGRIPVVLTTTRIRRFVRKMIASDLPPVAVLSFDELPPELVVHPLGTAVVR